MTTFVKGRQHKDFCETCKKCKSRRWLKNNGTERVLEVSTLGHCDECYAWLHYAHWKPPKS